MAKQEGPYFLNRTIGNLCFYYMEGCFYARKKSSLTAKKVKTSPRYLRTMEYAQRMACSSKIGSAVFKALPEWFKASWMYRAFVGEAMGMFKQGMVYEEVLAVLWERYAAEFGVGYKEEDEFQYIMRDAPKTGFVSHLPAPVCGTIAVQINKTIGSYLSIGRQRKAGRLSRCKMRERDRAPADG